LDICAEIAERRGLFFDVAEKQMSDGVQLSIRFSPSFRDPAHDGLKTNFDFVDDMEGEMISCLGKNNNPVFDVSRVNCQKETKRKKYEKKG
jgi:hypothetical protein